MENALKHTNLLEYIIPCIKLVSLRIADMTMKTGYKHLIDEWVEKLEHFEESQTGLIVFVAKAETGAFLQPPRGTNIAWDSFFLPKI